MSHTQHRAGYGPTQSISYSGPYDGTTIPTVPVFATVRPLANASTPIIDEISWTSALVSRGLVLAERSWESFAWRQGWVETWTFEGRDIVMWGEWNREVRGKGGVGLRRMLSMDLLCRIFKLRSKSVGLVRGSYLQCDVGLHYL